MKISLTGATGFVGKHILRSLLASGNSVRALVRNPAALEEFLPNEQLEIVLVKDLFSEEPSRLEEMLGGSEILVHAAWYAEPGRYPTSPRNVDCLAGTLALTRAFIRAGGQRFIGLGTCAEYDTSAGLLTIDTPLRPTTLYGSCKASVYLTLRALLAGAGVGFAWCRVFYLYGEGEDERRLVSYIRSQIMDGKEALLTSGGQVRDFLDVRDAAQMIVDVVLSQKQDAVNICSGKGITVRQLAERIADEYGRRDLLRFGARAENAFDPPRVVGVQAGS